MTQNPWINSSPSNWPGIWVVFLHLTVKLLQKVYLNMWRLVFWKLAHILYFLLRQNLLKGSNSRPHLAVDMPTCDLVFHWHVVLPSSFTHKTRRVPTPWGLICAWSSRTFLPAEIFFGKVMSWRYWYHQMGNSFLMISVETPWTKNRSWLHWHLIVSSDGKLKGKITVTYMNLNLTYANVRICCDDA